MLTKSARDINNVKYLCPDVLEKHEWKPIGKVSRQIWEMVCLGKLVHLGYYPLVNNHLGKYPTAFFFTCPSIKPGLKPPNLAEFAQK